MKLLLNSLGRLQKGFVARRNRVDPAFLLNSGVSSERGYAPTRNRMQPRILLKPDVFSIRMSSQSGCLLNPGLSLTGSTGSRGSIGPLFNGVIPQSGITSQYFVDSSPNLSGTLVLYPSKFKLLGLVTVFWMLRCAIDNSTKGLKRMRKLEKRRRVLYLVSPSWTSQWACFAAFLVSNYRAWLISSRESWNIKSKKARVKTWDFGEGRDMKHRSQGTKE
jgi:hypothetical protein